MMYSGAEGFNIVNLLSETLVNDGEWHFIKGERQGTTLRLYVDGVLEATGNTQYVVSLNGSLPTEIGRDAKDDNAYFIGNIDNVRVIICETVELIARPAIGTRSVPVATPDLKNTEDKMYPNPATNMLRLQLKNEMKSVNDLQVFDMTGRMSPVHARKLNNNSYELDVSRLAKGIYFIKAKTIAGTITYRFMKM